MANEFTIPPDLVVEIVSPEQSVTALVRRCLWYVAHGAGVALLVDPAGRSILVFRPNQFPQAFDVGQIDLGDVAPRLVLDVHDVFGALQP